MVKSVGDRRIPPTRTVRKEVRTKRMCRGIKKPLDPPVCGAPPGTIADISLMMAVGMPIIWLVNLG
jgi:hypothetical protein